MRSLAAPLVVLFFLLLPPAGLAQGQKTGSAERVGSVEKVADGVWMAPTESGSNAGWFLVGGEVIAVDSGGDAATGRAIVDKIHETTGRKPIRYLIVTHAHGDHGGGAGAFAAAGADVISHENAAPGLVPLVSPPERLRAGLVAFSERLALFGAPRRVAVYYLGPAHSASDIMVLLPDDKILFSGDVALGKRAPYMQSPDVDPKGWENVLARLSKVDIEKVVPGHGVVGSKEVLAESYGYVKKVNEIAATLVLEKTSESMIEARLRRPDAGFGISDAAVTPELIANIRAAMRAAAAKPAATPTPAHAKKAPAKKKG